MIRRVASILLPLALAGCGSSATHDWPQPNRDVASTRSAPSQGIDRDSVARLAVQWRYRLPGKPGPSGSLTATPAVAHGTVFLEDMQSNVVALDLAHGTVRWRHVFAETNPGPNGVAVAGGRVYGATDTDAFALDEQTGKLLWRRPLVTPVEQYVDIAPVVANGRVYVATVGEAAGGAGALYALSADDGKVLWRRATIARPWRFPEAYGGGAWYPPSVGGGTVYWGTANPYPYGGTPQRPNGGSYPGRVLYTDSLLALAESTGAIRWYDQVTPHDVRDYDFGLPPVLTRDTVFGAGKAGLVVAWSRSKQRRLWETEVGVHRNDTGPLPRRQVSVCPGLLGGVETPMAYADGRLYVPVVDLCMPASATGYVPLERTDPRRGRGELVALDAKTGRLVWRRRFAQPLFSCATETGGVVFTATFDGTVVGLDARDGATLWQARLPAGVNSCPAVAGGRLLVGAGVPLDAGQRATVTAFAVR